MITVSVTGTNVALSFVGPTLRHTQQLSLGYAQIHSLLLIHQNALRMVYSTVLTDLEVAVIGRNLPALHRLLAGGGEWCPQSLSYRRHVLRLADGSRRPRIAFHKRLSSPPKALARILRERVFVRWQPETHQRFSPEVRARIRCLLTVWQRQRNLPRELELHLLRFVPD